MLYIGADHDGFRLKQQIVKLLQKRNIAHSDLGPFVLDPHDDYPLMAARVAKAVAKNPTSNRGILLCDSGVGMCIAANKVKKIRAVHAQSVTDAVHSRQDNNTNVLCLGKLGAQKALTIITRWLNTPMSNAPRHHRRVRQINSLER